MNTRRQTLAALLGAPWALRGAEDIVKHPRELKFAPRTFAPPRAADFRHQLSNGATAFLVEDHDFPLINLAVTVRTGEFVEPPEKAGLAQLTGSQIRAGGTKTRKPLDFDEAADFLAASISSGIADVSGSAGLNCLSKDIDAGLALFVEMLRTPGFDAERLQLAKSQLLQSLERRNDSTASIEQREWGRLLRGTSHFSTRQATKGSIESITREDMAQFHARYFFPANFVFAVSGDFKTAEMLVRLEKAFGNWPSPRIAPPQVPKPNFTPKPGVYLVHKSGVNQGRVRMGHLGVMISNPDHLAISLMNSILGGGAFTSRITERVRSDEGLAYAAGSMFMPGTYYEGTFTAAFQSKSETVAQAVAIIFEEIDKIRAQRVKPEELETAKARAIEALPTRFATAASRAGQFASDFYTRLPEDYWQKYAERIRAVTLEEIQRVAQKYLRPEQMVVLAVGDADAILKGNPDKPQFKLETWAGGAGIVRIPLPDPLTMVYPAG